MNQRILVTYASRGGATAGVADAIGKALIEEGAQVDVRPMSEVNDLAAYDALVLGSAIQSAKWLPEAMQFVQSNRAMLSRKPCATFLVCMTLAMSGGEKYRPQVAAWLEPVRALIHPVSEGLFAGVLDLSKLPSLSDRLKFRLSIAMGVWKAGDHRDWAAIRGWAKSLSAELSASRA